MKNPYYKGPTPPEKFIVEVTTHHPDNTEEKKTVSFPPNTKFSDEVPVLTPIVSEEEKKIEETPQLETDEQQLDRVEKQEEQKKRYLTPKYLEWERLYLTKSNKETFGNATQSAITAYNLDPIKQYGVASQIGHENIRKHKQIHKRLFEELGITTGKLLEVIWNKAVVSNNLDLLQWVIDLVDADLPKLPTNKGSNNTYIQNNNTVEGGVTIADLKDDELRTFIRNKSAQLARRTGESIAGVGEESESQSTQIQPDPHQAVRSTDE